MIRRPLSGRHDGRAGRRGQFGSRFADTASLTVAAWLSAEAAATPIPALSQSQGRIITGDLADVVRFPQGDRRTYGAGSGRGVKISDATFLTRA
jgi:hypothetical protein